MISSPKKHKKTGRLLSPGDFVDFLPLLTAYIVSLPGRNVKLRT
jgi:hypothetical protein